MSDKSVPNLDTLGTYIERLTIEVVKLTMFETKLLNEHPKNQEDLELKIKSQKKIIADIKEKFVDKISLIAKCGDYNYYDENRTFSKNS